MRKIFFGCLLAASLLVSSCVGTGGSGSSGSSYHPTSVEERSDYEDWLDGWSKSGHLYLHYRRTMDGGPAPFSDYENYAIWIWQNAPHDSEGSLWAASSAEVRGLFKAMSESWMKDIGGSGKDLDQSGAICDIDLTNPNIIGGRSGEPSPLSGSTRVGFLIVRQASMLGNTHWTSDGGAETYIRDFPSHFRANGAMHVFCVEGSVSDFTFTYSGEVPSNPVNDDTTGKYRSNSDIDSSASRYGNSRTSSSFGSIGVGYQVFLPSFADGDGDGMGDIRGVIDKLPYLRDLGVGCLWLTPVQESGAYHGYDTVDYYKVDEKFGTIEDYRELIHKAHGLGMKVIMDLVLNHTSKNNVWFRHSRKADVGTDPYGNPIKWRDLYHWKYRGDKVLFWDGSRYREVAVEDHPDWYRDGESNYYYYGKFGANMAELNYDCQAARNLIRDMALYWLGFGLDGFRLDAVKHIYMRDEVGDTGSDIIIKDTGQRTYYDEEAMRMVTVNFDYSSDLTRNVNFWKEFAGELKKIYPDCFLVGENFDGYGARIAPYLHALDSQFDFSLYYHDAEILYDTHHKGSKANSLGSVQQSEVYDPMSGSGKSDIYDNNGTVVMKLDQGKRPDFINGAFTSNHDVERAINHVNGKDGDLKHVTGTAREIGLAKVHAASVILSPGISWIYYGDELGMSGNTDRHREKYGNDNNSDIWYRQPMKWGDRYMPDYSFNGYKVELDDYNATDALKSEVEQAAKKDDGDMLDFYRELCAIKNAYGGHMVYRGDTFNGSENVFHFRVGADNGKFDVYVNSGAKASLGAARVAVGGAKEVWALNGATRSGDLPNYGVIVVRS